MTSSLWFSGYLSLKSAIFFSNSLLCNTFSSFNASIESFQVIYPTDIIKKDLIKDEFILRGTKPWKFIFDKGLFQLIGEKGGLFTTSI